MSKGEFSPIIGSSLYTILTEMNLTDLVHIARADVREESLVNRVDGGSEEIRRNDSHGKVSIKDGMGVQS